MCVVAHCSFHEHILLRPTAHFSVEVFFYLLVFVPQINSFYPLLFFKERGKQLIIETNQQMYHPPEIAIVSFGVWILDTLYTQTPFFLNRITDTHIVLYFSHLIIHCNGLSMAVHIFLQHYFLIVLKHSIVSLYHILLN